jgi:ribosomal protein S18 acetylase RimI-like enzyme
MEKITDLDQLNKLLAPCMKRGVLTNNYLMYKDYKQYIEQGVLYYIKGRSGMLLFRDDGNHWRLLYYLSGFEDDFPLPEDKPSVMEVLFQAGGKEHEPVLAYWQSKGFKPYLPRKRMLVPAVEFKAASFPAGTVVFAQKKHAPAISALLSASFDRYLGCIPSQEEIIAGIERKEFICAVDARDRIMGVLEIRRRRNLYTIRHLVVEREFRGRGLARKMLAFLETIVEKDAKIKIELWVQSNNPAARRLYEKAGFSYDGLESVGLLYES